MKHWPITILFTWWRHQTETFSALLAICAGNSHKGQLRGALMVFYLRPNKRLSKQWWGWWFETPSSPLWCHCNVTHLHTHSNLLLTLKKHEDVITWKCNVFRLSGPLWGHRGSVMGLWIFHWYKTKRAVEHMVEFSVIWDAITLIWHHCDMDISISYAATVVGWLEQKFPSSQTFLLKPLV